MHISIPLFLVGLDFALLQKVRSEITQREKEDEAAAEDVEEEEVKPEKKNKKGSGAEKATPAAAAATPVVTSGDVVSELQALCRTNMAKNVIR